MKDKLVTVGAGVVLIDMADVPSLVELLRQAGENQNRGVRMDDEVEAFRRKLLADLKQADK